MQRNPKQVLEVTWHLFQWEFLIRKWKHAKFYKKFIYPALPFLVQTGKSYSPKAPEDNVIVLQLTWTPEYPVQVST